MFAVCITGCITSLIAGMCNVLATFHRAGSRPGGRVTFGSRPKVTKRLRPCCPPDSCDAHVVRDASTSHECFAIATQSVRRRRIYDRTTLRFSGREEGARKRSRSMRVAFPKPFNLLGLGRTSGCVLCLNAGRNFCLLYAVGCFRNSCASRTMFGLQACLG